MTNKTRALEVLREAWDKFRESNFHDIEAYEDMKEAIDALAEGEPAPPREVKSIAEDWLNEHKHTWSAHDLYSLIRLLSATPPPAPTFEEPREKG